VVQQSPLPQLAEKLPPVGEKVGFLLPSFGPALFPTAGKADLITAFHPAA